MQPVNLFYLEPDPDRWIKYDRFPRKVIRRIVRGNKIGGVMSVAMNLKKGLDKLGCPYRFNDFKYIQNHPEEIACIIGKPQVLFERKWTNPIIFGSGIYSHPVECPDLFERYPEVKRFLVPGEWMRSMCEPFYGDKVLSWPVGIDIEYWKPFDDQKTFDFLIYDKIRWDYPQYKAGLIEPLVRKLELKNLSYQFIKYGNYDHAELINKIKTSKAVIFLCEHETQGIAYQQILSTNTPILAWDRGGYWQDPAYYPHLVKYQPVSSVPYWDKRCGLRFENINDFDVKLTAFLSSLNSFKPRDFILENLTLEICANKYLAIHDQVKKEIS